MNESISDEKTKKINAEKIIEDSMRALGLQKNMKTDPHLIQSILKDMEIDDFKTNFPPMDNFFKETISKPKSLEFMFESIKKGLIEKHPAIIEFLGLAIQKKWLKKSEDIQRSVHITFILEAMTSAMCNNHKFFIEAQNHYRAKERALGLDKNYIFKTFISIFIRFHDFFKVAKILSIDPIMIYFQIQKGLGASSLSISDLKKIYKNKKINYFEYKLLFRMCNKCREPANELVRINIYEAGTSEHRNGFDVNAISAHALAVDLKKNPPRVVFEENKIVPERSEDTFYKAITEKENLFPVIKVSQDWVSLYTTWNMAFILGNLNNLDLLFPKLLMPSIINAKSENFLGVRVVSLWLSINHFLFRDAKKKEIFGPNNKTEMAKAWSDINKRYAFDLVEKEIQEDPVVFMDSYNDFFSNPLYRVFALVKTFFIKKCIGK